MTPIPVRICVGERVYSVDVVPSMARKREMGRAYYDTQRIEIAKASNVTGRAYTKDEIDDTFWHELTHAILHDMNHRLYKDEQFVTAFAGRLAKAINSAQFK